MAKCSKGMFSVGVGGQDRDKSLFSPGAHLSTVSGVHDRNCYENKVIILVFILLGRGQGWVLGGGGGRGRRRRASRT
jgi:hypothetical protein